MHSGSEPQKPVGLIVGVSLAAVFLVGILGALIHRKCKKHPKKKSNTGSPLVNQQERSQQAV